MIPLSHPVLCDYLREWPAARDKDALAREYLLDRLCEATAFVGDPGGPCLADACLWYARGEDGNEEALRWALAAVDETVGRGERPEVVRGFKISSMEDMGRWFITCRREILGVWYHPVRALRDLRRRVLALYPEVKVPVSIDAGEAVAQASWYGRPVCSVNENGQVEYKVILPAPDLIPPEPAVVGRWRDPANEPPTFGFVSDEDLAEQQQSLLLLALNTVERFTQGRISREHALIELRGIVPDPEGFIESEQWRLRELRRALGVLPPAWPRR